MDVEFTTDLLYSCVAEQYLLQQYGRPTYGLTQIQKFITEFSCKFIKILERSDGWNMNLAYNPMTVLRRKFNTLI